MKAAPVDTETGELLAERVRIPTPEPAAPEPMADVVGELASHFDWADPVGVAFPAVVQQGMVRTAANIDHSWIGVDAGMLFSAATSLAVTVTNDADAAGIAEMQLGVGRGREGTVVMVTLGTGIGTAVFTDGLLVPNTELGHLMIRGQAAEERAADSVREREDLSWKQWAKRLEEVLVEFERLLWPDLFIIGGGVSKKSEKFLPHLSLRADVRPAEMHNQAGIVGAALTAVGLASHGSSQRS